MFKRKPKVLIPEQMEEIRTKDFFDCILPGTIKFLSDHYIVGDSYRCVWAIREYPPSTEEQAILYGLPMAAVWLVGMIGGVNGALKDFLADETVINIYPHNDFTVNHFFLMHHNLINQCVQEFFGDFGNIRICLHQFCKSPYIVCLL